MTTIVYILLVLSHIWTEKSDPNDKSLFMWWKVCSYLWTMVYWWDWIISIVFWSFLLPTTDFGDAFYGKPWGEAKLMCDHIFPLFFCIGDWFLNGIVFEKHHLLSQMPVLAIYGVWNLSWVEYTGNPVYPGITWDSFLSVLLALCAFPFSILLWFLIYWCTNYKLNKFLRVHKDMNSTLEDVEAFDENVTSSTIDGDMLLQRQPKQVNQSSLMMSDSE
jgi:hypothetical protein